MGGLESRAARNVVIVATANKLARISWAVIVQRGKLSTQASPCSCQLDEVILKFTSQKSAEEKEGRKYSQMACPRTCVAIRSFTTVAIIKDGHARIIIMRPETILH
jgi:hypothetical protein